MKLFALSTNAALTFCVLPTVIAFLCPNTRNQKSLYLTDSQGDFASKPIKNDTTADIVDDKFLLKTKSENNALTDRFKYKVCLIITFIVLQISRFLLTKCFLSPWQILIE